MSFNFDNLNQLQELFRNLSYISIKRLCSSNKEIYGFCRNNRLMQELIKRKRDEIDSRTVSLYSQNRSDWRKTFNMASAKGDVEVMDRIVTHYFVPDRSMYESGFREAIENCQVEAVSWLSEDYKFSLRQSYQWGLIEAIKMGCRAIVNKLRERDCYPPSYFYRILPQIILSGNRNSLQLLLEISNIDPSVDNNNALILASKEGLLEIVDELLKDPRVEPSDQNNQAIFSASVRCNTHVMRRLLQDSRVKNTLSAAEYEKYQMQIRYM